MIEDNQSVMVLSNSCVDEQVDHLDGPMETDRQSHGRPSPFFRFVETPSIPTTSSTTRRIAGTNDIELCFSSDSSEASDDELFDDRTGLVLSKKTRISSSSSTLLPKRWLVLVASVMTSFTSSWMWISFSPITVPLASYWNVSTSAVNALSSVYLYTYVLASFLALFLIQEPSQPVPIFRCFLLGAVLNAVGAEIRYALVDDYLAVYLGTMISSCGQAAMITIAPPLLTSSWHDHQPLTTGILQIANHAGTAVGLGATIFVPFFTLIDTTTNDGITQRTIDVTNLQQYLHYQLAASCFGLLLVALLAESDLQPAGRRRPEVSQPSSSPKKASQVHRKTKSPTSVTYFDVTAAFLEEERTRFGMDEIYSVGDESSLLLGDAVIFGYGGDCTFGGTFGGMDDDVVGAEFCTNEPSIDSNNLYESVRQALFQSSWRTLVSHVFVYGLPRGVLYSIPTFLSQLLWLPVNQNENANHTSLLCLSIIGWLGIAFQLSGLVGYSLVTWSADCKTTGHRNSLDLQSLLGGASLSMLLLFVASVCAPMTASPVDNSEKLSEEKHSVHADYAEQVSVLSSIGIVTGLLGSALFLAAACAFGSEMRKRPLSLHRTTTSAQTANGEDQTQISKAAFSGMFVECPARLVGFILVTAVGWILQRSQDNHDGSNNALALLLGTVATSLLMVVLLQPETMRSRSTTPRAGPIV